jgi:hypothetical protein
MKKLHLLPCIGLLFLASCSTTYNKSHKSGVLDLRVRSELQADIEVDMTKKISGAATHSKLFGIFDLQSSTNFVDGIQYGANDSTNFIFSGGMVEEAKSAAAFNAIFPNDADIIVTPQYLIKVKKYFFGAYREVTAQVTGYAGKIKNIAQAPK